MKKLVVPALSLFLGLSQSLANTNQIGAVESLPKHFESKIPTQTKSVLVLAVPRAQRRLLITHDINDDENDNLPGPDELDLQTSFARNRISKKQKVLDDELSEYAQIRLAVARAKAMQIYRNKFTQNI